MLLSVYRTRSVQFTRKELFLIDEYSFQVSIVENARLIQVYKSAAFSLDLSYVRLNHSVRFYVVLVFFFMSMVLSSLTNTQSKLRPKVRFLLYCQAGEVGGGWHIREKLSKPLKLCLNPPGNERKERRWMAPSMPPLEIRYFLISIKFSLTIKITLNSSARVKNNFTTRQLNKSEWFAKYFKISNNMIFCSLANYFSRKR